MARPLPKAQNEGSTPPKGSTAVSEPAFGVPLFSHLAVENRVADGVSCWLSVRGRLTDSAPQRTKGGPRRSSPGPDGETRRSCPHAPIPRRRVEARLGGQHGSEADGNVCPSVSDPEADQVRFSLESNDIRVLEDEIRALRRGSSQPVVGE